MPDKKKKTKFFFKKFQRLGEDDATTFSSIGFQDIQNEIVNGNCKDDFEIQ